MGSDARRKPTVQECCAFLRPRGSLLVGSVGIGALCCSALVVSVQLVGPTCSTRAATGAAGQLGCTRGVTLFRSRLPRLPRDRHNTSPIRRAAAPEPEGHM